MVWQLRDVAVRRCGWRARLESRGSGCEVCECVVGWVCVKKRVLQEVVYEYMRTGVKV